MNPRKARSGGQAIVMVSLSLFAMAGMMGLAVDLGWSYFVQKQAQSAADAGALAAVHEVYARASGGVSGISCSINAECKTTLTPPVDCTAISTGSNLYNGCEYASINGFAGTQVKIVANIGGIAAVPPPPVAGIPASNIAYWATYRTVATIPQLFSAMLGNTQGTIAAKATAAILSEVVPGSFLGMNREGDCQTDSGGAPVFCGVDLDVAGSAKGQCKDSSGANTQQASICGPAGIFLASQCHGTASVNGQSCGSSDFAGQTHPGNASIWGSVNEIQGAGAVNDPSKWTTTPIPGGSGKQFSDPTEGEAQPPIAPGLSQGTAITPCPVTSTTLPSTTLGPFQYYHVDKTGKPDGAELQVASGATFSANGTCPNGGGVTPNQLGQNFPAYVFYGGLDMGGSSVTFGPGQYVMAGTISQNGGRVLESFQGNFTGDSASGTMFILTDPKYPGLVQAPAVATAIQNGLNFYQGSTYFKNISGNLTGINDTLAGSANELDQYGGILFWQDRRNTSLAASGHYDALGKWVSGACTTATCGATNTSPEFNLDHGNVGMVMKGVLYQPRGAWMTLSSGGAAINNSPLQVITGSLIFTTGGGNANVVLLGPTAPLITFKTALIQ